MGIGLELQSVPDPPILDRPDLISCSRTCGGLLDLRMDSSRRAVESYWRSRMIDAATSDEDKVTPVYKLEEICELLRCSHLSIVKEVSEFVLKRLDHKSPIVKQKALRLIKFSVGKSGVEFRREMQRHSGAVRQLFHYKGQLDPLKGDALNKAVRDTAHEAMSAIFSSEDHKPAPSDDLSKRIQGFGNTNFEMQPDDKKSFLSEVVDIGSASIKQGLSSFAHSHSLRKNETGSYKSPNLRRSLTTEIDDPDRYGKLEHPNENQGTFAISKNVTGRPWAQDLRVSKMESTNVDSSSGSSESRTHEERLLETIVTPGGVRLQPTRDSIQSFLIEAAKLDGLALSQALELKLQSHLWQVRMKAICVLESILRKKDDEPFLSVASYFSENKDGVVRCSESPQASLREKANKVLSLLVGEESSSLSSQVERQVKFETATVVQMPDLIDTGYIDDCQGVEDSAAKFNEQSISELGIPTTPAIDNLFGDSPGTDLNRSEQKAAADPFADVSFHTNDGREHADDLFSGMTVSDKPSATANDIHVPATKRGPELFDIFGPNPELQGGQVDQKNVHDIMAGLSIDEDSSKKAASVSLSETMFSDSNAEPDRQVTSETLNGILSSQAASMNPNVMHPLGPHVSNQMVNCFISSQTASINPNAMLPPGSMPYNISPGILFNPAFASQAINYGAMGNFFSQQQLLASMPNFQQLGNLGSQGGVGNATGAEEGYSSALPDIFNPNVPTQTANSVMTGNSKKEDTKAFDFISDHLAAARDPRKVA